MSPVPNNAVLASACSGNFAAAFAALIPHSGSPAAGRRKFGAVDAIATGFPRAFYNPVLVTEAGAAAADLEAGVQWIRDRGLPASAQIREDFVADADTVLRAMGLVCEKPTVPGMAMAPIAGALPAPAELVIRDVTSASFDDWHAGIDYGPRFRETYVDSLVSDAAFRFVVGYVDFMPVTGAAAIIAADVVGIYAVGTKESARRRGYGAAATWAALAAGAAAGARIGILQSSPVGESMYRHMGFRDVCRYAEYTPVQ